MKETTKSGRRQSVARHQFLACEPREGRKLLRVNDKKMQEDLFIVLGI